MPPVFASKTIEMLSTSLLIIIDIIGLFIVPLIAATMNFVNSDVDSVGFLWEVVVLFNIVYYNVILQRRIYLRTFNFSKVLKGGNQLPPKSAPTIVIKDD